MKESFAEEDRAQPREEQPGHRAGFRVGGVSVQLASTDQANVTLVPALEPFRDGVPDPDIKIQVEWAECLSSPLRKPLFDSGSVWRLYKDGDGFQFDFSAPLLLGEQPYKRLLVDRFFRRAILQMSAECFAGTDYRACPLEYPLDELLIMHRLTQENAIELHACGIVRPDGTGNLFVGHSGAGKSTTTRLWTEREDVEVLSDDRIIVRRDDVPHARTSVETPFEGAGDADKHEVLRLRENCASRTSHFAQDDRKNLRMYGTPWHGEAAYASPGSASLARIFILEHGHGNVLTRLSPSQAVAELFARSFVPFHHHEYVDAALEFLEEVVDAVPCYRYAFEPNASTVERILEFRD